jgi:hypothetical protein
MFTFGLVRLGFSYRTDGGALFCFFAQKLINTISRKFALVPKLQFGNPVFEAPESVPCHGLRLELDALSYG